MLHAAAFVGALCIVCGVSIPVVMLTTEAVFNAVQMLLP